MFDNSGVDVALSVFFKHQDSTIVWLVTNKIDDLLYEDVSMLYKAEGGVIMLRDDITKNPTKMQASKIINWAKALIHLVFQVICTFSQIIYPG